MFHQVNLDLAEEYKSVKDSVYGEISVKAKFDQNTLHIEVMNARNLIAMDSNGNKFLIHCYQ